MTEISKIHKEAMGLADQSLIARLQGDNQRADKLIREAYEKERTAASFTSESPELEPTRSVLHRSAASLALECGEVREAERLIGLALSGNPPGEIAEELRDLLEQVYFHRHLDLRGIKLASNEFQISLSGDSVGFGIAQSEEFIHRVKNVESLFYRTVERKLGKEFRERGRRKKSIEQEYELYVSVPRAASFAVSFRIGRGEQLSFPGIDFPQDVIDEILSCFDLFNSSQMESLKDRIADSSYYRNFVGLARNISPDGKEIKSVGFTTLRDGRERKVVLSTPRNKISIPETIEEKEPKAIKVEVRGTLRFADARSESEGFIELLEPDGKKHRIKVPRGMMIDIVRPMFEEDVVVSGYEQKGIITLDNIEPAE